MLISTPLSHGIGSVALKTVLLLGGSCVLQPRFDPDRVLQTVEAERISSLLLVPTSVYRILDSSEIGRRDTSSLECLLYGGSPMSPDRAGEAIDRFGRVLVQQYGSREAKVVAILGRDDHDPTDSAVMSSAGRQCLGVNLQVLDADLRPVPIGEVGEICTRSPASVPGYWRRDDESRELLRGGWVHSGDLAVADERGFVTIKDRIKQVIISGGHNVVPREVEDALAAHPDVALAAVFGVPDANWGEAVQAVVVPRPGAATIDTADLRQFVKDRVGSVNAPKNIEVRGELPLTTAGKVDKPALRRPYWKDQSRDVG
jgi:fatty-acyl-CoA synthase